MGRAGGSGVKVGLRPYSRDAGISSGSSVCRVLLDPYGSLGDGESTKSPRSKTRSENEETSFLLLW